MTAKGGSFMAVVEADCQVGRSAETVDETRIARPGCISFLMQERPYYN